MYAPACSSASLAGSPVLRQVRMRHLARDHPRTRVPCASKKGLGFRRRHRSTQLASRSQLYRRPLRGKSAGCVPSDWLGEGFDNVRCVGVVEDEQPAFVRGKPAFDSIYGERLGPWRRIWAGSKKPATVAYPEINASRESAMTQKAWAYSAKCRCAYSNAVWVLPRPPKPLSAARPCVARASWNLR